MQNENMQSVQGLLTNIVRKQHKSKFQTPLCTFDTRREMHDSSTQGVWNRGQWGTHPSRPRERGQGEEWTFGKMVFFKKIRSKNILKYTPAIEVPQHIRIWRRLSYSVDLASSNFSENTVVPQT